MVVRVIAAPPAAPPRRRRRWRSAALFAAVVALLLIAAAALLVALSTGATLSAGSSALAKISLQPFAGTLVRATALGPDGSPIPLRRDGDRLTPLEQVTPGESISVDVVIRRPGWLSWALGSYRVERLSVRAPLARLDEAWLTVAGGAPVRVSFERPVSALAYQATGQPSVSLALPGPQRSITLGGLSGAGSAEIRAAVRPWEKLGAPLRVTWLPPSHATVLLASPAPGSNLSPTAPITLTFSQPVATLLGSSHPTLSPASAGSWSELDSHTWVFTPSGAGEPLGSELRLTLPAPVSVAAPSGELAAPATLLTWTVPLGSTLRLQQLLAQDGYLPFNWTPSGPAVARTAGAQAAAALAPPAGQFSLRYRNTPALLTALWHAGRPNPITRGAVMTFEHTHGLAVDGLAGPIVWRALLGDAIAGRRYKLPYSYVYVHSQLPQKLTLWSAGRTILTSPGNTGIPSRPTAPGTFAVFEHIPVGTMSGTNPDGLPYHDPGIRWISYFNGGDALHAFPRASYGTPQSLGCVELPLAAAAKVWPYTPIGTLVTIEKS
jgi:peptidoglycan hydrolase-like protein with peptidoglycan-binding domain